MKLRLGLVDVVAAGLVPAGSSGCSWRRRMELAQRSATASVHMMPDFGALAIAESLPMQRLL